MWGWWFLKGSWHWNRKQSMYCILWVEIHWWMCVRENVSGVLDSWNDQPMMSIFDLICSQLVLMPSFCFLLALVAPQFANTCAVMCSEYSVSAHFGQQSLHQLDTTSFETRLARFLPFDALAIARACSAHFGQQAQPPNFLHLLWMCAWTEKCEPFQFIWSDGKRIQWFTCVFGQSWNPSNFN